MGSNLQGQLGLGKKTHSSVPCLVESLIEEKVINVSCGIGYTAAVTSNGNAYTWGLGEYLPMQVKYFPMNNVFVESVSCGAKHTVFIGSNKAFGCGSNELGQLGVVGMSVGICLHKVEVVPKQMMSAVSAASCGEYWTLLLAKDGTIWGTGLNNSGQLGLGHKRKVNTFTQIKEIAKIKITKVSTGDHSAALSKQGEVFIWGTGVFGEVLVPQKLKLQARDISIGSFGLALDLHGKVWAWGTNTSGELGMGDYKPRVNPCYMNKLQGREVVGISCGKGYAIALGITHTFDKGLINKEITSPMLTAQFTPMNLGINEGSETELVYSQETSFKSSVKKTLSNFNGSDISSTMLQNEPNNHLIVALTRQREYLEEVVEKERKERAQLEDANARLKSDLIKLNSLVEELKLEKTDMIIAQGSLKADKQKSEEMSYKVMELESTNELLNKLIREKDNALNKLNDEKINIEKKFNESKAILNAHVDTQERVVKENEELVYKMQQMELKHIIEKESLEKSFTEQSAKINNLKSQLHNSNSLIVEKDNEINKLKNTIERMNEECKETERESNSIREKYYQQTALCNKYQSVIQSIADEFTQIKKHISHESDSIKVQLMTERKRTETATQLTQQQSSKIEELQKEKSELKQRVTELELKLKTLNERLIQFKKLNEDLEVRNHELMQTVQQNVNDRSKYYKEKTLSALTHSEAHKILNHVRLSPHILPESSSFTRHTSGNPLKYSIELRTSKQEKESSFEERISGFEQKLKDIIIKTDK